MAKNLEVKFAQMKKGVKAKTLMKSAKYPSRRRIQIFHFVK